ncbi:homocysteine S-methyltransferase family protein [Glaciecola siphonariae]|uniref:Homocysteine S-methyltransferase family protein n=1 Tax=Glaciecola siphonariae TaxID=521012 RepID=A0ABV9LT02_9ALTE
MKIPLILDGGMGQELLRRSARPITPMWSADIMLHEPQLVADLHLEFIKAGADVITLNTYTATPPRLTRDAQIDLLPVLHEQAQLMAEQARMRSNRDDVHIAGCLPPLVASYKADACLAFEQSLHIYRELVALQAPASDIFICETMSSIDEAKAACTAAKESGKETWVAFSVKDACSSDADALLRSGESLNAALLAILPMQPDAVLLNCSVPEAITACWALLQTHAAPTFRIGAYANGFTSVESLYPGDTVEVLTARKDLSPSQYANHAMHWFNEGASIVGGCCEIGPAHIDELSKKLRG